MGAWIEMRVHPSSRYLETVAPFMGAWIEIGNTAGLLIYNMSHPSWVRGLKLVIQPAY